MPTARKLMIVVVSALVLIPGVASAGTSADSPSTVADTVQELHDRFATGHEAGDFVAIQVAGTDLRVVLDDLTTAKATSTPDLVVTRAKSAAAANDRLAAAISAPVEQRQLGGLAELLNGLLAALMALVSSLLGGLPIPPPPI